MLFFSFQNCDLFFTLFCSTFSPFQFFGHNFGKYQSNGIESIKRKRKRKNKREKRIVKKKYVFHSYLLLKGKNKKDKKYTHLHKHSLTSLICSSRPDYLDRYSYN